MNGSSGEQGARAGDQSVSLTGARRLRLRTYRAVSRVAARTPLRGVLRLPVVRGLLRRAWLGPDLQQDTRVVEFDVQGVRLRAPARIATLYVRDKYEPLLVDWLRSHLHPGETAVDVGAHIGYLAVVMSQLVGPSGTVHAVEPVDENLDHLRHNLEVNDASNVVVHPVAAGDRREIRAFHMTGSSDSHGFYEHPLTGTAQVVDIQVVPVDELVSGPVHLAKVDVEGAELTVLGGMQRVLKGLDRLVVEWTPACQRAAGHADDALVTWLRELGYQLTVLDDTDSRVRSVEEVLDLLRAGRLAESWYANLVCTRPHTAS